MKIIEWVILLLPLVAGLGSGWTVSRQKIPKTRYNPPAWVFMTVWPILYLLLGWAGLVVYQSNGFSDWMRQYYAHLIALMLWWPAFVFWRNSKPLALLVLMAITIHAGWLMYKEPRVKWIMLPYILWLCVANFLTYTSLDI